mmetsp:Transcript_29412/g.70969  ORF Transcript_29412/g.70969 Transcript_29412/m.70969 type:complete len:101 (-) Transcript_29412:180-482(-)
MGMAQRGRYSFHPLEDNEHNFQARCHSSTLFRSQQTSSGQYFNVEFIVAKRFHPKVKFGRIGIGIEKARSKENNTIDYIDNDATRPSAIHPSTNFVFFIH